MTRKEKADKKRAKRQTPTIQGTAIEASTPSVDVSPDLSKPEEIAPARPVESVDANTSPVVGQAVTQNATPAPVNSATKPLTFSDMLEAQRQNIVKDKTDAVKMQKYYALTDALKALGQMGGAAIGGAIGGNMLDSAPAVPEYKESRGYLDAVERARKANDRLRALDEQGYSLIYKRKEKEHEYDLKKALETIKMQAKMAEDKGKHEQAKELKELAAKLEADNIRLRGEVKAQEQEGSKGIIKYQADLYNNGSDKPSGNQKPDSKTEPAAQQNAGGITGGSLGSYGQWQESQPRNYVVGTTPVEDRKKLDISGYKRK